MHKKNSSQNSVRNICKYTSFIDTNVLAETASSHEFPLNITPRVGSRTLERGGGVKNMEVTPREKIQIPGISKQAMTTVQLSKGGG